MNLPVRGERSKKGKEMTTYAEAEARWIDRKFEELDEKLEQEEREEPE